MDALYSDLFKQLEKFAKEQIFADKFPNDYHFFKHRECDKCGSVLFEVSIEHHTGSKQGDFKGIITGRCTECGKEKELLHFTGSRRKPERTEEPACQCGYRAFFVGECQRIESDEGVMGFFDEGVLVGKCRGCGRNQVLVATD